MPDSTPVPTVVATPEEVKSFRAEQEREWGQYVAIADITFNGTRAYNAGDPVPSSNVAKYNYEADGYVAKVSSKKAADVVNALHANASVAPVADSGNPVTLGVSLPSAK